jgi:membrane fusion protein, heavy metal efflux system
MVDHDNDDVDSFRHEPGRRGRRVRVVASIVAASGLLMLGAIGGAALTERRQAERRSVTAPTPPAAGTIASPPTGHGTHASGPAGPATPSNEPVEVTLTPEALQRAGIKIVMVTATPTGGALTVPGTVTSNAYRDTKVNALVGGIVRQVAVELGSAVDHAQPLAVIFSSELADAQMKYLSMRASFEADHQKLVRTQKLADIGASSRQELEEVTAVHHAHETELAATRQRLLLLGLSSERVAKLESASQVVSEVTVSSPAPGLVVTRSVNPGQVVGAGQELFVVTDLSSVWVIADLYEKDFALVRVGTPAAIALPSRPNAPLRGRVAYIDPRVEPSTRTAKVRVEVPNRNGELRLGMFVEVTFTTGTGAQRTVVPRAAVQSISGRSVVYVATEDEGRFVERTIRLGSVVSDGVEVLDGLNPGERIAVDGSFYLRAEAGRTRGGG